MIHVNYFLCPNFENVKGAYFFGLALASVRSKNQVRLFKLYKRIPHQKITDPYFCPQTLPPKTLGNGVKRSKFNFSEHGHVAYQIKWNYEKMQQHDNKYFARRPTPMTLGNGVKINLFQNMFMLHIKLKGITHAVTW